VNTRLQVEHPVTEMVTGTDLIREQLRIVAGEPILWSQEDVKLDGWAMECRIAAEDPLNDFLPSLGRVDYVREPSGPGIRVDSTLYAGCDLSYHYDPMVAKVIAWGRDREEAVRRMKRALGEFVIVGVRTNVPLHLQLLDDERFLTGRVHTRFLETEVDIASSALDGEEEAALVAAALLVHRQGGRKGALRLSSAMAAAGRGWGGRQECAGARRNQRPEWRRSTV
jgi:acetyl/propionyl-CoA carboxylase alpha subunit